MGRIVMGYWDCPVCGAREIRGDITNCPSCGRGRGDVKFYLKNHAENEIRHEYERGDIEYLSEAEAKYVSKNPDWFCSYCESLNSDNAPNCKNCGASRTDSEHNYFDRLKKLQEQAAAEAAANLPAQKKNRRKMWVIIFVVALALAGLLYFLLSNTTPGDWTVTSLQWTRTIEIEHYHEAEHSGWSLPEGAKLIKQQREIHHYDQVLDHYETVEKSRRVVDYYETTYSYKDLGNGRFEEVEHRSPVYKTEYYTAQEPVYRSEPRYQTKYYYTLWEWGKLRDETLSGSSADPLRWPEVRLESEYQRNGNRYETYYMTVSNEKGASAVYSLSAENWKKLKKGDVIHIVTRRIDSNPYISLDGSKVTLHKEKAAPEPEEPESESSESDPSDTDPFETKAPESDLSDTEMPDEPEEESDAA